MPGKNILINADFRDPVNQRGQSSYTGKNIYTIDRWITSYDTATLNVNNGYIEFSPNSLNKSSIQQYIETLPSGQYTFSILCEPSVANTSIEVIIHIVYRINGIYNSIFNNIVINSKSLVTASGTIPENADHLSNTNTHAFVRIYMGGIGVNSPLKIYGAKLETGSNQTLAYQNEQNEWILKDPIPNKAETLMECWRYYYVLNSIPRAWAPIGVGSMISSTTHRMNFQIPIPCSLRVPPTITQVGTDIRASTPDGSVVIKMNQDGLDSMRDGMILIYFKPAETLDDYGFGSILIASFRTATDNILLDSEIYS